VISHERAVGTAAASAEVMTRSTFPVACAFLALSSPALAGTPAAAPHDLGSKSEPSAKGAYEHDGFYLRTAAGIGAYNESFRAESTPRYGGESGGYADGFATMGEIAVGYAVKPGFIVGGSLFAMDVSRASFEPNDGVTVPNEVTPKRRELTLVGPFVDWYPNARRGLHFQGSAGFAVLAEPWKHRDSSHEPAYVAIGGGATLGVGYDWFVSEQWSLGVMAHIAGAIVTGTDDNDVRFYHAVGTSPSLLLAATYN
jgi:hypothetical protein